jgi:hypothetical protein
VLPGLELERAVGDDVRRLGPLVAELVDGLLVHGQERVVRGLLHEPRLRRRQLDLEGLVVDRGHADFVAQGGAVVLLRVTGGVLVRTDDAGELVRVVRSQLGRDGALPRVLEVTGHDRIAVRPLESIAKDEGDGLAVLARLEALGRGGHGIEILVELDERVHDVEQDVR